MSTTPKVSIHLLPDEVAVVQIREVGESSVSYCLPLKTVLEEFPALFTAKREAVEGSAATEGLTTLVATPAHLWRVNGLATFGYAYHEKEGLRVAIGIWPRVVMDLRYRDGNTGEVTTYKAEVPDRVVVGLWEQENLYIGGIFLCQPQEIPHAVHDPNGIVRPWHLGNVNGAGGICFGTAGRPAFGLDGVTGIHDAFFGAAFNADIPQMPLGARNPEATLVRDLRGFMRWQMDTCGEEPPVPLNYGAAGVALQTALQRLAAAPW